MNPEIQSTPAPFSVFNSEGVYSAYVKPLEGDLRQAQLIVNGIHCAGCVRAIEGGLRKAGALEAQVNFGNHRAQVVWDDRALKLGDLISTLARLGYESHPYDPATQEALHKKQMRMALARLGVAGFAAANVMMFSVGLYAGHFYGIEAEFQTLFTWISALFSLPAVFFSGWPFLRGAWGALRNGRFNMDSLITLGIGITFLYSWGALLARTGTETYFDSAVMIVFFLLIGRTLEILMKSRAGDVTEGLMGLQVKWAIRIAEGGETTVPIESVRQGDRLLVRPGDAIPTDGRVLEGESELNESALTGESIARAVGPGDAVLGGVINLTAPVVMEATRVGAQTVVAHICRLVEQARTVKPPLQRLADRIAGHFVSAILVLAAGTFVFWEWIWSGPAPQSPWITAIAVLIIACPCALGLATPVAVLAGAALAARRGVLVKGGEVLERAARVTDVVLDKTGTLTEGRLSIVAAENLAAVPLAEWLPLAGRLEQRLVHPIADAVVAFWRANGTIPHQAPDQPQSQPLGGHAAIAEVILLPGLGASGHVDGARVTVGNGKLMEREGIPLPPRATPTQGIGNPPGAKGSLAETWMYVAVEGKAVGLLRMSDPLRPDAARAVAALRRLGVRLHLFSGDRQDAVSAAARATGIETARGAMLPDDKLTAIQALQAQGRVVAMIGDGINDAPALTQADLSIAVGTGSDLALDAAQVLLMRPRLLGIVETLTIARRTLGTIRGNLALSLGYNAVAVPLAMAGLVIPLIAALAMSSSSLLVVLNALRLRVAASRPGAIQ